jgi:predicted RecB family nuclease
MWPLQKPINFVLEDVTEKTWEMAKEKKENTDKENVTYSRNRYYFKYLNARKGRVVAQVVSHRPLTAEAWVRVRVSSCRFYGGRGQFM